MLYHHKTINVMDKVRIKQQINKQNDNRVLQSKTILPFGTVDVFAETASVFMEDVPASENTETDVFFKFGRASWENIPKSIINNISCIK